MNPLPHRLPVQSSAFGLTRLPQSFPRFSATPAEAHHAEPKPAAQKRPWQFGLKALFGVWTLTACVLGGIGIKLNHDQRLQAMNQGRLPVMASSYGFHRYESAYADYPNEADGWVCTAYNVPVTLKGQTQPLGLWLQTSWDLGQADGRFTTQDLSLFEDERIRGKALKAIKAHVLPLLQAVGSAQQSHYPTINDAAIDLEQKLDEALPDNFKIPFMVNGKAYYLQKSLTLVNDSPRVTEWPILDTDIPKPPEGQNPASSAGQTP